MGGDGWAAAGKSERSRRGTPRSIDLPGAARGERARTLRWPTQWSWASSILGSSDPRRLDAMATSVGPARCGRAAGRALRSPAGGDRRGGGREFKDTGDGLMVAFASASAAVRCAVSMQHLTERRYRRSEQKLRVRIGLGAGESTIRDGNYFGMPSIEAARLCAQAEPAGILVSPAVRMLATRLDGIRFESVGELALKGFPEPVEAFAVPWTPLADEAVGVGGWPLPACDALGAASRIRRPGHGATSHRANTERGARRHAPGGADRRRAGDRQEPPGIAVRPRRTRRGVRRAVGGLLGGAHGALRAVDLGVLPARRARTREVSFSDTSSDTAANLRASHGSCRNG